MQDFNFFELYIAKRRHQGASDIHLGKLLLVVLVILAVWPMFNIAYAQFLQWEGRSLERQVISHEKYSLMEVVDQETKYIEEMKAQLPDLDRVDKILKGMVWLDEPFFYGLMSTVPGDVRLDRVVILPDKTMTVEGTASGKPAIAELEHNIRETNRFASLQVSSISHEEDTYTFTMSFQLKGGGQ